MWINRISNLILNGPQIVHFQVEPDWGTHFAVSEIGSRGRPLIWIDIDQNDSGVSVGNKLSDSLHRAFNTRLFGYGLPLNYCLKQFKEAQEELGQMYLAVSGDPSGQFSLDAIFDLDASIVLCGTRHVVPDYLSDRVAVYGERELALTIEDALEIALDRASEEEVSAMFRKAEAKYEPFIVEFQSCLGLPPPERPYPDRYVALGSRVARPDELIDAHVKRGFWIDAFESAVRSRPQRIPELIDNAAEQYLDKGLIDRLSEKLALVSQEYWNFEPVAYWMLTAAIATNSHRSLIPTLKARVDLSRMPNVRALMAIQNLTTNSLVETQAAYDAQHTLITTRAHAFCLSQFGKPEEGLVLLMAALREAQSHEKGRELISIGSDIAHAHSLSGEYKSALAWAEWALAGFQKYDVNEEILHLFVKSQVQYMRLLTADDAPERILHPELVEFGLAGIPTFEAVISTLGDFEFVLANFDQALALYDLNRKYQSREQAGHFTLDVCRSLLSLGRTTEAHELAEGAIELASGTNEPNQLKAAIARGISSGGLESASSRVDLELALEKAVRLNQWDAAAICSIALAGLWLREGSQQSAGHALLRGSQGLHDLGKCGWKLFGGWHANFDDVRTLWDSVRSPTFLAFLGGGSLVKHGVETKLSPRNSDILAVLAIHPEGLSGEQLSEKLYASERNTSTLKATLSKMRSVISIESQPYRIAEFIKTDFQRVEEYLGQGSTREAVLAYVAPLLPDSTAPYIESYRDYLDEAVRQAVLRSTDVDSLFEFAQKRNADLEVWEKLMELLDEKDSRSSFVRARVVMLREEWNF